MGAHSDDSKHLQQTSKDMFWLLKLPDGEPGSSTTQHFFANRFVLVQRLLCNKAAAKFSLHWAWGGGAVAGRRGLVWLFLLRSNCFHPKMVLLLSSVIQPDPILEEGGVPILVHDTFFNEPFRFLRSRGFSFFFVVVILAGGLCKSYMSLKCWKKILISPLKTVLNLFFVFLGHGWLALALALQTFLHLQNLHLQTRWPPEGEVAIDSADLSCDSFFSHNLVKKK